jgi:hypothetical protein
MICIAWYVKIFSFKIIDINIVIFIYNLHFLWKKKLQAEVTHNIITVGRNKLLISISNYAYHKDKVCNTVSQQRIGMFICFIFQIKMLFTAE